MEVAAVSVPALPLPRDFFWVEAVGAVDGEEDQEVMVADFPEGEVIAVAAGQAEAGNDAT